MAMYDELKQRAGDIWASEGLLEKSVAVRARALTAEEAIGNPEAYDFPIQKGKERLMQAEFGQGLGQAFTDRYGNFEGTLTQILDMSMENNYRRGIFIATINAVLRHLGLIDKTVHCKNQEPAFCAVQLAAQVKAHYQPERIGIVGFQPRMVERLASEYPVRLLDLDPDNIGTRKFDVLVEGPEAQADVMSWADLLLVTGTTIVNDTIEPFLDHERVVFYGTTIAGAAYLMGWERFCACGS